MSASLKSDTTASSSNVAGVADFVLFERRSVDKVEVCKSFTSPPFFIIFIAVPLVNVSRGRPQSSGQCRSIEKRGDDQVGTPVVDSVPLKVRLDGPVKSRYNPPPALGSDNFPYAPPCPRIGEP